MNFMTIRKLDLYIKELLQFDDFSRAENGMNGLQFGDYDAEVTKAAFAVDACAETFRRAAEFGAQILIVHHGLFWGRVFPLTGRHYRRIKLLADNNLGLYGIHLPLDAHMEIGNAAGIAGEIGLKEIEPFGMYHGKSIGCKGSFDSAVSLEEVKKSLSLDMNKPLGILPFGKTEIKTAGIISGGATWEAFQAIDEDLDLYITGDAAHEIYHHCLEDKINIIFGGHYYTETYGINTLCKKITAEMDIETLYIDLPTGL